MAKEELIEMQGKVARLGNLEVWQVPAAQSQALAQLSRMIDQQVFTRAANDVFLASSFIFLGLMMAVWLTRRPAKAVHGIEAGGHAD